MCEGNNNSAFYFLSDSLLFSVAADNHLPVWNCVLFPWIALRLPNKPRKEMRKPVNNSGITLKDQIQFAALYTRQPIEKRIEGRRASLSLDYWDGVWEWGQRNLHSLQDTAVRKAYWTHMIMWRYEKEVFLYQHPHLNYCHHPLTTIICWQHNCIYYLPTMLTTTKKPYSINRYENITHNNPTYHTIPKSSKYTPKPPHIITMQEITPIAHSHPHMPIYRRKQSISFLSKNTRPETH